MALSPGIAAPARVAVIDDERHLREMLEMGLEAHGFEARCAADGQAGLRLVSEWRPEAIVLDVMMPKIDGLTLLPMIRRLTEAPVIMLSAKGDTEDRIAGIARGADDYLGKPFSIEELAARLRGALRRPRLVAPTTLTFADLSVDLDQRIVRRGTRMIDLSQREFDLLIVLLRDARRVFSRDHLLDLVWGERSVLRGSVETYISYLRSKVDLHGEMPLIHTVRGAGYVLRDAP